MRFIASAPGAQSRYKPSCKAPAQHGLYVLNLQDINFFRIRTYSVVETVLKTRHFNSFGMHTYRNSARNSFVFRTYKNWWGEGVAAALVSKPPRIVWQRLSSIMQFIESALSCGGALARIKEII